MVLLGRIELPTSPLPRVRSTTELLRRNGRRIAAFGVPRNCKGPLLDGSGALRYCRRMTEKTPKRPKPRDEDRPDRLKQALKANLARRKAQARARAKDRA